MPNRPLALAERAQEAIKTVAIAAPIQYQGPSALLQHRTPLACSRHTIRPLNRHFLPVIRHHFWRSQQCGNYVQNRALALVECAPEAINTIAELRRFNSKRNGSPALQQPSAFTLRSTVQPNSRLRARFGPQQWLGSHWNRWQGLDWNWRFQWNTRPEGGLAP